MLSSDVKARGALGIGFGLLELLAPRMVQRVDALSANPLGAVRAAGAHKLLTGAGMMMGGRRAPLAIALLGSAYDLSALIRHKAKTAAYVRLGALAALDLWLAARAVRQVETRPSAVEHGALKPPEPKAT